jgi:cytochrome b561
VVEVANAMSPRAGGIEPSFANPKSTVDGSNPAQRYGHVAMLLHWSIAILVLSDFGLALYFNHTGDESAGKIAYQWHMSIGMCVLVLAMLRIAWRLTRKYPALPPGMSVPMRIAARTSHVLLYVFILAVPLTGWGIMSLRKQTAGMLDLFEWPGIPYIQSGTTHAQRVEYHHFAMTAHSMLAYAGIGLVGVHLAASLYHHYHRRDDVLRRMLPALGGRPMDVPGTPRDAG